VRSFAIKNFQPVIDKKLKLSGLVPTKERGNVTGLFFSISNFLFPSLPSYAQFSPMAKLPKSSMRFNSSNTMHSVTCGYCICRI